MDRLSALLPAALRRRGMGPQGEAALAVHRASQWLTSRTPALCPLVRPERLKDGVLTIACANAVAMQECQGLAADLLAYLRSEGSSGVKSVRPVRA